MAWLYKRGEQWWIGWRENGTQYRKSTGETSKEKANVHLDRYEAMRAAKAAGALNDEMVAALTGRRTEKPTLKEFFTRWLKESEAATKPITMVKYRQVMREAETALGPDNKLEDISSTQLKAFFADRAPKYAAGTMRGWRRIINSAFLQAQEEGLIKGNPAALAKRRSQRKSSVEAKEKRPFTRDEIQSLFKIATPFWQYMLMAGYYTGLSLGDLITLRRENVNLATNEIAVNRRKTGTRVKVWMKPKLRELLESLWPKHATDYFWPKEAERYERSGASAFSQEFFDMLASIGLVQRRGKKSESKGIGRSGKRESASLGFHNVRHTFVTALKESGAVDSVARELAGHGSNAMSSIYTHLPSDVLAKAIASLPEVKL